MVLSSQHASTVPIVLNPSTRYITLQFHVVFDNWFSTIASTVESLPDYNSAAWSKLFGKFTYQYPFDNDNATAASPDSDPFSDQLLSNKRYMKWTRLLPLWIGLYLQLLPRRTTTDLSVSTDPFTADFQFFPSPDVLTEGEAQT